MKQIKNSGYQGVQICIKTPKGPEFQYLKPRKSIVISEAQVSNQIRTLAKRRRIEISNI